MENHDSEALKRRLDVNHRRPYTLRDRPDTMSPKPDNVMQPSQQASRSGTPVSWPRRSLVLTVAALVVVLATWTAVWECKRAVPVFSGTVAISFTERYDQPHKRITVSDPTEVQRIVGTIRLRSKKPCECSHIHEVTFQTPTGRIDVTFCDHCFGVLGTRQNGRSPNGREYSMPREFYAEFRRLVLSRTNEHWRVSP